jgi:DNA-binding transcriptional regulator YdaS (Cro superfamily)
LKIPIIRYISVFMTNHEALRKAVVKAGGQLPFAKVLKTTQSNVWTWLNRSKNGLPAEYVLAAEAATGVPRHELRPDIYPAPRSRKRDASEQVAA